MNDTTPVSPAPAVWNPPEPPERVLAGTVAAFVYALVGAVLWMALYQLNVWAGISALIGVSCACSGYERVAGKRSIKGAVIAAVIAWLVLVAAWYLCLANDLYNVRVTQTVTYFDALLAAYRHVFDRAYVIGSIRDLGLALLFCVLGMVGRISRAGTDPNETEHVFVDPVGWIGNTGEE